MSSAGAWSASARVPPARHGVRLWPSTRWSNCGHCQQCRSGWTILCANGGGLGTTVDGRVRSLRHRAQATGVSRCQRASRQSGLRSPSPSRARYTALDRAGPVVGADVLVTGAGPAGLLLTRLLSLGGARVDVVERIPLRPGSGHAVRGRPRGSPAPMNWTVNAAGRWSSTLPATQRRSRKGYRWYAGPGPSLSSGWPGTTRGLSFLLTMFSNASSRSSAPIRSAIASGGRWPSWLAAASPRQAARRGRAAG